MIVVNETYMRYLEHMIALGPVGYCPLLGKDAVVWFRYETMWVGSRGYGLIVCQN